METTDKLRFEKMRCNQWLENEKITKGGSSG